MRIVEVVYTVRTSGGLQVAAPYRHRGPARVLVHRLKYHADLDAGRVLAAAMAGVIDQSCTALVPVPRALARRFRYGIDVGSWLGAEVGRLTGLPVVAVLSPTLWWSSRASGSRGNPGFRCRRLPPSGAWLLDDVVTTGATLGAAATRSGARCAAVATVALGPLVPRHN